MIEKALELVDVVVQDRQQAAAAACFKEAHLQLLQMVVGLQAQFVLHRLRQVAPEQGVEVLEQ